jgi:hypothetical protein
MPGGLDSILNGLTISKRADWLVFVQRLDELVRSGHARRIPPLWRTLAEGEEWYLDTDRGEVYVYVSPDAPILPIWEKVDVFSKPEAVHSYEGGLGAIPMTKMSRPETESLKEILKVLVRHGAAEVLDRSTSVPTTSPKGTETWYRDPRTKAVFRLVEGTDDDSSRWERVALSQKEMAIQ